MLQEGSMAGGQGSTMTQKVSNVPCSLSCPICVQALLRLREVDASQMVRALQSKTVIGGGCHAGTGHSGGSAS